MSIIFSDRQDNPYNIPDMGFSCMLRICRYTGAQLSPDDFPASVTFASYWVPFYTPGWGEAMQAQYVDLGCRCHILRRYSIIIGDYRCKAQTWF